MIEHAHAICKRALADNLALAWSASQPVRARADDDRAEQHGQQPPVTALQARAHHTVRVTRRMRAGRCGVLLPPGPRFQVGLAGAAAGSRGPQVKDFFQLVVVQAGTRWASEVGNERGDQAS